jgi:hypothetical protein
MRALTALSKAQLALFATLVLTAAIGIGLAADRTSGSSPSTSSVRTTLPARETTAGPVEIKVTPLRLDASGAAFKVALDNHEIDLTMNLAKGASLTVGSLPWTPASWSGDGPGGHHREGTLTFASGGAAAGEAVLTLAGFPSPVQLQWTLPEGGARS